MVRVVAVYRQRVASVRHVEDILRRDIRQRVVAVAEVEALDIRDLRGRAVVEVDHGIFVAEGQCVVAEAAVVHRVRVVGEGIVVDFARYVERYRLVRRRRVVIEVSRRRVGVVRAVGGELRRAPGNVGGVRHRHVVDRGPRDRQLMRAAGDVVDAEGVDVKERLRRVVRHVDGIQHRAGDGGEVERSLCADGERRGAVNAVIH